MGITQDYLMAELTPDERRQRLRDFMKARGLNANEWALRAGFQKPNAIYNFLKGRSNSMSQKTIEKLAAAANVHPQELFAARPERNISDIIRVVVRGAVQAGAWLEAVEWPEKEHYEIAVPKDDTRNIEKAFGLVVRGASMDLEYPADTILVCIRLEDLDDDIRNGDHVIVEDCSHDGLVEISCKELVVESENVAWLWPRSTNPKHQAPIQIPWPEYNRNDGQNIQITAIVTGFYQHRKRVVS